MGMEMADRKREWDFPKLRRYCASTESPRLEVSFVSSFSAGDKTTSGGEQVEVVLHNAYGHPKIQAYPSEMDTWIDPHVVEYLATGRPVE